MDTTSPSLVFTVQRHEPQLVAPAKPTPREYKLLSDIDSHESYRSQVPVVQFYRHHPSMEGIDPAKVIKEALAKTLVFYYPFAGRLRERPDGKLMVDCTAEGVLFIEADADVTLEQFGVLRPPIPCLNDLLFCVPVSEGILNFPLLLIQITRLKCNGFVIALRINHTMTDAFGLRQFLSTIGEMARGGVAPSVSPLWERHLLDSEHPPRVTCTHNEYAVEEGPIITPQDMVERSFFFGSKEISSLRRQLPLHLPRCSTFELLTACLWRCRTVAINPDPNQLVRMLCAVNTRSRFNPPLLPLGYYGNGFVSPAAMTTARQLCENPLGYAVERVKQAKASVTKEYVKSVASLMVMNGQKLKIPIVGSFLISDVTKAGFEDVDYGWGKAVFGGPPKALGLMSPFVQAMNKNGEVGIWVAICLSAPAMERFAKELDDMLNPTYISSSL